MENTKTPILQLRQDDVVAIPRERFEELIEAETRLSIIINRRVDAIIDFKSFIYKGDDDYILGSSIETAWKERERLRTEYREMLNTKEKE